MCVTERESGENKLLSQKAEPSPEIPTQVKGKEETARNRKRTPWKEKERKEVPWQRLK